MQITVTSDTIRVKVPFDLKDVVKTVKGYKWNGEHKSWDFARDAYTAYALLSTLKAHLSGEIDEAFYQLAKEGQGQRGYTLAIQNNKILLTCEPDFGDRARQLPNAKQQQSKNYRLWQFPATPAHAKMLFKEVLAVVPDSESLSVSADFLNLKDTEFKPVLKTPFWKHQSAAFAFGVNLSGVLFAMGMGTGKSKTTIDLINSRGHKRVLIIAPSSVVDNHIWQEQFSYHSAANYSIVELAGGSVERRVKLAKAHLQANERAVVVLNYEGAWRPGMKELLLGAGFDCVVFDECHKLKTPSSAVSEFAKELSKGIPYRIGLSGTPTPNGLQDIYAIARAIDCSVYGTSYAAFKGRYCIENRFGGIDGYQNQAEYRQKFYQFAFRVTTQEAVDLPDLQEHTIHFDLTKDAQEAYNQLDRDFALYLSEDESVTTTLTLTKLLRLQQLTSGYLPLDGEGQGLKQIHDCKEQALSELLEAVESDEPYVVFCKFAEDLQAVHRVARKLGRKSLELSGQRKELQDWIAGKAPILAVQIQAGGAGIDLTRSHYVCYFSTGYNNGDYEQSFYRCYRPSSRIEPGQKRHPVIVYHLVARGTIDDEVRHALQYKQNITEYVIGKRKQQERAA